MNWEWRKADICTLSLYMNHWTNINDSDGAVTQDDEIFFLHLFVFVFVFVLLYIKPEHILVTVVSIQIKIYTRIHYFYQNEWHTYATIERWYLRFIIIILFLYFVQHLAIWKTIACLHEIKPEAQYGKRKKAVNMRKDGDERSRTFIYFIRFSSVPS